MSARYTPWFPASQKPVRIGLYQCKCSHKYWKLERLAKSLLYWNGRHWYTPARVVTSFGMPCDSWRGLASKA